MSMEIDRVLHSRSTGFSLEDGKPRSEIITPKKYHEFETDLLHLENQIVSVIRSKGQAVLNLKDDRAKKFLEAQGSASLLLLADPSKNESGASKRYFATIHPDTSFERRSLVLTVLGSDSWIPWEVDPANNQVDIRKVWMVLSAQNRFATTGDHSRDNNSAALIADPRHLTSTMGSALPYSRIQNYIGRFPESEQHHIGDELEYTRSFAQTFSARNPGERSQELWQYPVTTFTYPYGREVPFLAIITPDFLSDESFNIHTGSLETIQLLKAYEEGSLVELQLESFAKLLKQNGLDTLQRKIDSQLYSHE